MPGSQPIGPRIVRSGALALVGYCLLIGGVRGQGYPPDEAITHMEVAPGLSVSLMAAEPLVRQPILVKCDDRGRLWTIQYLQYPNPAGLERVKVDRWSRTVYDRVPEPPPRGPRGEDRITILLDDDGDGRADRTRDFVAGLNLCTGLEFGYGGVFVLQVPYLLFYPDRDRNDVPDSDPEVLLEGFGMEDAQSLANHLTWGPDGWLYGVNGSTTTCRIRGIEFQQGVWRYHPRTRRFELWCEGGSNTYGLTFDERGRLFYSTNAGPFVHGVDGGYFYKSFGKHGPLHNPYAYHFFPPLDCDQVPGGPPTGGTIYQETALPDWLRGKFVAGNFLGHTVSWWNVEPAGSTVRARYGGVLLDAHDTWFGPTDLCVGPQGELYVSDFHDQRTAHPDPDAQWDRSNGRIVRITAAEATPKPAAIDLAAKTSAELVTLLETGSGWWRYRARAELAARRDGSVIPKLRELAVSHTDTGTALEAMWAWHVSGGIDQPALLALLEHADPWRRAWAVRLAVDASEVSPAVLEQLRLMTVLRETELIVFVELACAARRLPPEPGIRLVFPLIYRSGTALDPRLRGLVWWAVEQHCLAAREKLISWIAPPPLSNPAAGPEPPMNREFRLNLIRRYAAEGTALGYDACLRLLRQPRSDEDSEQLGELRRGLSERARPLGAIEQGGLFAEQAAAGRAAPAESSGGYEPVAGPLAQWIAEAWRTHPTSRVRLELALLADLPGAGPALVERLTASPGSEEKTEDRVQLLELLSRYWGSACRDPARRALACQHLLADLAGDASEAVQLAALGALAHSQEPETGAALLAGLARWTEPVRRRALEILLCRPATARQVLEQVDRKELPAEWLALDQLRLVSLLGDGELDELVRRHWGNIGPGTPEEKLATMRRLQNDLRAATGDATRGRELFLKHCGTCHRLAGVGQLVGPDLTAANRHDRAALLANLVDPSAVVRREYLSYVAETSSGRIITGLVSTEDAAQVTLVDARGQSQVLARDEIAELRPSTASLMPERIWEAISPEELRDLFAFLEQ